VKRDPSLSSLSRDHHQALVIAQKLQRATSDNTAEPRAALLAFWDAEGRRHFRLEEEVLLPAFAAHGDPYHPLVARVLCDHVAIRHRVRLLGRSPTCVAAGLRELGRQLAAHVRLEERELFPLIETAMSASQLAALARDLERAESSADE
jgi:iron-sulfur cluster repair protein YtfE (RIC family)